MAKAFRRKGRGDARLYVATLDADERDVVATLMEQVAALLEPPTTASTGDEAFDAIVAGLRLEDAGSDEDVPDAPGPDAEVGRPSGEGGPPATRDPALDRLLPVANREDEKASAEFRRLTEGGLRHRKAAGLLGTAAGLRASGNEVTVDGGAAPAFLTALTDVRLVLGSRLGLETDEDLDVLEARAARLGPEDPLGHALALYDFLTWLQETLATALLRD